MSHINRVVIGVATLSLIAFANAAALGDAAPADARQATAGIQIADHAKVKVKGNGVKFKAKQHGAKIKYAGGGPPPWAPAHGYRRKAGYYDNLGYRDYGLKKPPLDLASGLCNRDIIGQIVGGGLGALAGSQIGKGDGHLVAVAAGTILGVLVGGEVGRQMDRTDALCVDQALESAPDGETIVWNSDRRDYSVTPTETVTNANGQYCREYIAKSTVGGRQVETYGTACRQPDGAWKLMS